jgi:hypothetical protein
MIGNVFLFSEPRDDSRAGVIAPEGALVEVLAAYDDWLFVRVVTPERQSIAITGWVPQRWVGLIKPVPPDIITPTPVQ